MQVDTRHNFMIGGINGFSIGSVNKIEKQH